MSHHRKQWINDAELRRRGGRYVGVVVAVVEEVVRNPCGSNSPGPASPPHGDSGTGSRRTPALDRERAQHRSTDLTPTCSGHVKHLTRSQSNTQGSTPSGGSGNAP